MENHIPIMTLVDIDGKNYILINEDDSELYKIGISNRAPNIRRKRNF